MPRHNVFQARDSVTGVMYRWLTKSNVGDTGYPGPNAATELVRLADNRDVEPDSGLSASSAGSSSSPFTQDLSPTLIPKRSGWYHLIWDVQMVVAVAAATVTVQPRIDGADVASYFRVITIPSGASVPVTLIHRVELNSIGSHTLGLKLTWSGSATITPSWRCLFQEL